MLKKLFNIFSDNFYFSIAYLIISLGMVTILKDIPLLNKALLAVLGWGILLSVYHIIKILIRGISRLEIAIAVFLGLTLAINLIFYRNAENLKFWVVNLIILTGVFYIDKDKSNELVKKELFIISNIIAIFTLIFSSISTVLYFASIKIHLNDVVYGGQQGLYVYKNSLAIASAIGLLLSLYCYVNIKNRSARIFYIFNGILQLVNVLYSRGRGAYFLLLAIPILLILGKIKFKAIRWGIIGGGLSALAVVFAIYYDKLYGFLAARNELWISAIMLIKKNLLFGVGSADLVQKVHSMRPRVVLPGIEFGGLHNIYLQVITANGIVVFLVFIVLLLLSVGKIINSIDSKNYSEFIISSLLVGVILGNFFESNLIYITSFISIIFWTYLVRRDALSDKL